MNDDCPRYGYSTSHRTKYSTLVISPAFTRYSVSASAPSNDSGLKARRISTNNREKDGTTDEDKQYCPTSETRRGGFHESSNVLYRTVSSNMTDAVQSKVLVEFS
jgi:hypothetical protein